MMNYSGNKTWRRYVTALMMAVMVMISMIPSAAFADNDNGALRDQGVKDMNDAYEFIIDTEKDAVGASAAISSGGWSSLGSKLSYMEFPEGTVTYNGETGVWCYCIDITTSTKNKHKYSITTLDAAEYYEDEVSGKIRAIMMNSYPYMSVEALENKFGLEDLTEEEAFIATQWIIWYYSNPDGLVEAEEETYYPANIYKPSEYPDETISLWYDDENGNDVYIRSANTVKLAKALDALDPAGEYETEPVELIVEKRIYEDKVIFDFGVTENLDSLQNLSIIVKDEKGDEVPFALSGNKITVMRDDLIKGDNISEVTVEINAEQVLKEDVYFFSPEEGRAASQCRVAVFSGTAPVAAIISYKPSINDFEEGDKDAQLKVNKKVLFNGEAHRSDGIYYAALFEDAACTLPADKGDVREIRMDGKSEGSVIFDELEPGRTYYAAETDADGNPLKDGDLGIETIAYDKQEIIVTTDVIEEVTITNCYVEEPGGGDGDNENPGDKEDDPSSTGDDFNLSMILMALVMSLIVGTSVVLFRRRNKI